MFNILHVLVDMKYEPWCERKTKIKENQNIDSFPVNLQLAQKKTTKKTVKIWFDHMIYDA